MRIDEVLLHFLEGENEGVEIKVTPPRELYIGRSEESDIFLGEKKISRKHSMIIVEDDEIRISDLESTNGTYVNGKKITEVKLKHGDQIKVGSSVIEVEISSQGKEESSAPSKKEKAEKPVKAEVEKPSKGKPHKEEPSDADFGDLSDEVDQASSKSKKLEEDSDLVVEYQTAMKEPKKVKDHETSEKHSPKHEKSQDEFDLEFEESKPVENEPSFDKLPDLDLGSGAELDVSSPEEEVDEPVSSKPMTGDLSSMGLSDLIQNLNQNKKTGIVSLSTSQSVGKVLLNAGKIIGAEAGKSKGLKAIYRMLTWKNGDFEFQPLKSGDKKLKTDQKPVEDSVESILMEGFRQFDELRKIQKVLPMANDELALEEKLDEPISKLHPKVLDVVQLIINHKKMKNILDLSSLSDLETSKIIFYLLKKKVVRIKK